MIFEIINIEHLSFKIKRVRSAPGEYACIGCDQKLSDHETMFETRNQRIRRGAAVDDDYRPMIDIPTERQVGFGDEKA